VDVDADAAGKIGDAKGRGCFHVLRISGDR
jgi:hypothetical protein